MSLRTTLDPTILDRVLERAAATPGAVCIFDLDSTLLDNRPRQARILREFGQARGVPKLAAATASCWVDWSIGHAMANCGLGADEIEALVVDAKEFWRERFFTSEYCRDDEAIAGARDYLIAVAERGATIAYCTGRHEEMRAGSVDNFERLGYPLPDGKRVQLFMKPVLEESDDDYKEETYPKLRALGTVIAAFDNEPTHVNGYRQGFPEAFAVHLATDHSGRPVELLPGILSVSNFVLPR